MIKLRKYACKKGWHDDDESTIESSKVDHGLKNLFDFDDLCGVKHTPV